MIKKKAQIYGQIFIYILTIVLISFILVFGYNAVHDLKDRAKTVSCLKFEDDLKNSIASMLSDFGSVKIKNFKICEGYSRICFVETFENFDESELVDVDPLIKDSILSKTENNAFLVDTTAKEYFNVGSISAEPNVLCINARYGQISLKMKGLGNHVLLSEKT